MVLADNQGCVQQCDEKADLMVDLARARTKLIVIGSRAFFYVIPDSESMLDKAVI